MTGWKPTLLLGAQRHLTSGGIEALCAAVRGDTDLQIGIAFSHGGHIDLMAADESLIV